jgi:hypothetical protein
LTLGEAMTYGRAAAPRMVQEELIEWRAPVCELWS